jgi:uncharacterized membrane protein
MIAALYLFYPVAQTAVLFGIHGDTLAMPWLIFAFDALERKRWRLYGLCLLGALSCKFYVAIPVMAFGGVLWLQKRRRLGILTSLLGVTWLILAIFLVRPLFGRDLSSLGYTATTPTTLRGYLTFYFGGLIKNFSSTFLSRFLNFLIVIGPSLWVAHRKPVGLLPALVIAVPAVLSSGPGPSYLYRFHRYALTVPFLMTAVIDGAEKLKVLLKTSSRPRRSMLGEVFLTLGITVIFNVGFVQTPLNPMVFKTAFGHSENPLYVRTSRDALKDRWTTTLIPTDASVVASDFLAPHLANRQTLYTALPSDLSNVDYVFLDALFEHSVMVGGETWGIVFDIPKMERLLAHPDFALIETQDGLTVFQRNPPSRRVLSLEVDTYPISGAKPRFEFDGIIGLIRSEIQPVGDQKFRFSYDWTPLQSMHDRPRLFAVTRLMNISDARIVHLPTQVLLPTSDWKSGNVIQESFEIRLSDDVPPGVYKAQVGWYDSAVSNAYATDSRSRVGELQCVGILRVD